MARRSSFGRTRISRSAPPTTSAWLIPSTCSRAGFTTSSANSVRVSIRSSPRSTRMEMGREVGSQRRMSGRSASSGKSSRNATRSMASRRWRLAKSIWVPHSYSTVMVETPSRVRDTTWRTPARAVTTSSMGWVTSRSRSSAGMSS